MHETEPTLEEAQITFHGHVQGVGFRWRARTIATRLLLTGCVYNTDAGTVRARAIGPRDTVLSWIQCLEEAFPGKLHRHEITWGPAHSIPTDFTIASTEPA